MSPKPPLKILMLHGYTQSGPLFRLKTRALEKSLAKAFPAYTLSLTYPTAPLKLAPADIPTWEPRQPKAYGDEREREREEARIRAREEQNAEDAWAWWTRSSPTSYTGLEVGFASVSEVLRTQGPFDGVVGFSQGAAMAGLVAAALETGRAASWGASYPTSFKDKDGKPVHGPLRFAVLYSGFKALDASVAGAFEPPISTPAVHFIGSLDTVVEEKRSLALVEACEIGNRRVVYHPGGHFVPASQREYVGALVGFLREVLAGDEKKGTKEEKAEDMDLPFGEGRL